ncbi:ferrous iron transporter B [Propionivibrio dicarboxylicus]|uniref:Ferrous iron transport protein B n=1 Tax=Propionivibrio dicarboxylicus TaxID=83767 RepID=A0A1G8HHS1_9RHOO|nr:ferrous iron transporter B [Propionivibrio dicarboxylicus]SDI06198.1 ferrous iron transport protein B [Propionivibrio dicarboxylicus]
MRPTPTAPLRGPLLRGARRPRVVLVGRFGAGKSTIFEAASSPVVRHEHLAGLGGAYQECIVDVGLDQISLVDLPSIDSLHRLSPQDQVVLMYLLWGDQWPEVAPRDAVEADSDFPAPDVLVQVVDATALEQDLELALELSMLGRPMVIALNRIDEARRKGRYINVQTLSARLGVPVIPTNAAMGKGVAKLFETIVAVAREKSCPLPQPPTRHIAESLHALQAVIATPEIENIFRVPRALLLSQLAENDDYFLSAIGTHFPPLLDKITTARAAAEAMLPRPLPEEVHADRHHRAALLHEAVSSARGADLGDNWRHGLDKVFLHRRWGLVGSLLVFAAVLFIVLQISALIDAFTSARLAEWVQQWQPDTTPGVIGRAVADGLVGLVGIVAPYMLPLVLLLVLLEESGVMHRVAFVVDRGFHRIGLHGGVAVPFLMGLGCNVPAISAATATGSWRERVVAAILITFVPCSARSAILLAIGGKYLGGAGVLAIFVLTLFAIAVLGKLLSWRLADSAPGVVQSIPPYSLPRWSCVWRKTWSRTEDIVTIVTPLLVVGSVVLALLSHFGADRIIDILLTPVTVWWLGLPEALGVPILFGVLRKELSMLMIQQALGTADIAAVLDPTQIFTFLVFLTFYVPCLSTFAVTYRALGRKEAWFSATVSLASALVLSGLARLILEISQRMV